MAFVPCVFLAAIQSPNRRETTFFGEIRELRSLHESGYPTYVEVSSIVDTEPAYMLHTVGVVRRTG